MKVVNRQAKLVSLDISQDGKKLAVGDEVGKIYVLYNYMDNEKSQLVIQSLPHWHS